MRSDEVTARLKEFARIRAVFAAVNVSVALAVIAIAAYLVLS